MPNKPIEPSYSLTFELIKRFDAILSAANALASDYENGNGFPLWFSGLDDSPASLRRVLFDTWYEEGQEGNTTRQYIGLVGAGPEQMAMVKALNRAKDAFSETLREIKQADKKHFTQAKADIQAHCAKESVRDMLGHVRMGRLHLKQTWRHIPIAEERMRSVHFSWYSSGRSIKRISVADAEKMLSHLDEEADHVAIQRRLLAGIPSSEPLARVRDMAPIMRANLFFETPNEEFKKRRALSVSMPIFIPLSPGEALPDFNEPAITPPSVRTRKQRSDVMIEEHPFLKSLRVYRYMDPVAAMQERKAEGTAVGLA